MVHSIVLWDGGGIRETKEKKTEMAAKEQGNGSFFLVWLKGKKAEGF